MKKGDFIKIDYVARVKGTNAIFDLTMQDVAEKEKLDTKGQALKPATIILGAGQVIKGLEAELEKMSVGEEKTLTIPAKDGFGLRRESMIKTITAGQFKNSRVPLVPGVQLNVGGVLGRIQSVSGGRVRIDMNHPLAGKDLTYDIKVLEKLEKPEEKIKALLDMDTGKSGDYKISLDGQKARITHPKGISNPLKDRLKKDIIARVPEIREVEFSESAPAQ